MSMAARLRQVLEKVIAAAVRFGKNRRGSGAIAVGFGKNHRGSGSIFFEDIEKLHEFGRISVFTNETP